MGTGLFPWLSFFKLKKVLVPRGFLFVCFVVSVWFSSGEVEFIKCVQIGGRSFRHLNNFSNLYIVGVQYI